MFNFLALLDIRVFGRLYNHCGFWLASHFFYTQGVSISELSPWFHSMVKTSSTGFWCKVYYNFHQRIPNQMSFLVRRIVELNSSLNWRFAISNWHDVSYYNWVGLVFIANIIVITAKMSPKWTALTYFVVICYFCLAIHHSAMCIT